MAQLAPAAIAGRSADAHVVRRVAVGVMLVLAAVPHVADAACPEPADWARDFRARHARFYAGPPSPALLAQLTPSFGTLLSKEAAYAGGEVGHLDYDPWLGAQDGEIGQPVTFEAKARDADTSEVSMRYRFVLGDERAATPHVVHLVLRRHDGCWRLDDFVTPTGDALSEVFARE